MTIIKRLPPVHIHPTLYIFMGIAFLTGTFVQLFILFSVVIFHELGHYFMALRFKWRVQRVMIWVFGGVMETEEHSNKPVKEDMLVTLAGPFQHLIIYGLLYLCAAGDYLPRVYIEEIATYNTFILLFNLLPIWPLDGGKLLFCLFSIVFPYQRGYYTVIIWSMLACLVLFAIQLIFFSFNLSFFLLMSFLFMENIKEWKRRFFVFMRFLLQRYHGKTYVAAVRPLVVGPDATLMEVFSRFERNKKHSVYITYPGGERRVLDENDCLRGFFHEKLHLKKVGEIAEII
ncbi:M50 family metallopeptidase [Virgibacillus halophilus]|uniref:M50 family metallopeptidase n=1 Tax=Tigheibacillus halophilus TaxID=361280 RepID=UPI00363F8B7B